MNYQLATFISDPYDTHTTVNDDTIYNKYLKRGITLMIPGQRKKKNQIIVTESNIHRLRYSEDCYDYASAMMNARYPQRRE